jgi:iron complex transport system permease protein
MNLNNKLDIGNPSAENIVLRNRKTIWIVLFITILVFLFSLFLGRYRIPPLLLIKEIISIFRGKPLSPGLEWSVFYHIRLPRILMVMGVGAALSLAGGTYQSIFRNPLVSPDILGVTAGASFGAALGMILPGDSFYTIYLLAFFFGLFAVFLSYGISILASERTIMMMVLSGIVVSSLFNAFISILKYLADPYEKLPGIVFWLMGGFNRIGWSELRFSLPIIIIGILVLLSMRWYLNIISMGDEEAISMGLNLSLIRFLIIFFSTLMVAASVATTGQISWIGLIVPHITRYLIGANHRFMLPAAALLGALLLLVMDNIARTIISAEIPISIVTALLGAPIFIYLLIARRRSGWN